MPGPFANIVGTVWTNKEKTMDEAYQACCEADPGNPYLPDFQEIFELLTKDIFLGPVRKYASPHNNDSEEHRLNEYTVYAWRRYGGK